MAALAPFRTRALVRSYPKVGEHSSAVKYSRPCAASWRSARSYATEKTEKDDDEQANFRTQMMGSIYQRVQKEKSQREQMAFYRNAAQKDGAVKTVLGFLASTFCIEFPGLDDRL